MKIIIVADLVWIPVQELESSAEEAECWRAPLALLCIVISSVGLHSCKKDAARDYIGYF